MISPNTNDPGNDVADNPAIPETKGKTRDLHVKGVPEAVWCRARCNATQSGMSFKESLIILLTDSVPLKREA